MSVCAGTSLKINTISVTYVFALREISITQRTSGRQMNCYM